jgi:DNA-directed RNA polymerase specialized sigma24 family protein
LLHTAEAIIEGIAVQRNEILERLRERILRFAASKLTRDAAEDLAQEVLLVLHEKYPTLDRVEDLVPLSLEIARFKIMAARRKIVRRGEHTQVSVDDLPLADTWRVRSIRRRTVRTCGGWKRRLNRWASGAVNCFG